jgi:hypothetical protein
MILGVVRYIVHIRDDKVNYNRYIGNKSIQPSVVLEEVGLV